ncbi:MAG: TatD family hydrolase [Lachnospiraceae bacterium]
MKEILKIFDTHAHYDDESFNEDREELLEQIKVAGVQKVVNIGCNMKSSRETVALIQNREGFYGSVGIHPSDAEEYCEAAVQELETLAENRRIVAIGEIGLDYYWNDFPKEVQKEAFLGQLELARKLDMPVVIHSREAAADTFQIMKEHAEKLRDEGKEVKGVIHCYSGSYEMAEEYIKLGYYLGIGGVITYKNARKLVEVVEAVPLEWLVTETDCPYLTPVPNRGKRNDSSNISYVIEKISEIKGINIEQASAQLWENAHRLYGLPLNK